MTTAQSLSEGAAGAALLAAERGKDPRPWLAEMVAEPVSAHPDEAGLFEGAPAVAFTFTLTTTDQPRALARLDAHVESITRTRLDAALRCMDAGELPTKREFDLISGLTGLGVYLLHRHGGNDLRSMRWPGASPMKRSSRTCEMRRCATAGPDCSTSRGGRARAITVSALPCRACSTASPTH